MGSRRSTRSERPITQVLVVGVALGLHLHVVVGADRVQKQKDRTDKPEVPWRCCSSPTRINARRHGGTVAKPEKCCTMRFGWQRSFGHDLANGDSGGDVVFGDDQNWAVAGPNCDSLPSAPTPNPRRRLSNAGDVAPPVYSGFCRATLYARTGSSRPPSRRQTPHRRGNHRERGAVAQLTRDHSAGSSRSTCHSGLTTRRPSSSSVIGQRGMCNPGKTKLTSPPHSVVWYRPCASV